MPLLQYDDDAIMMMPKPTPFSSLLLFIYLYTYLFLVLQCEVVLGFLQHFKRTKTKAPSCLSATSLPKPIDSSGWPDKFPAKEHCSKCGLCETTFVSQVTKACAFINEGMGRIDKLEQHVHNQRRNANDIAWSHTYNTEGADEGRFGVLYQPMMLARGVGIPNAQWTGCVTAIALAMLESEMVDAVVCIANDDNNSWNTPKPILAKTREDVLRGRGVKPALAPSLRVLDEIQNDPSIRKLLFCGVGCAVQAFRSIQDQLGLEQVYVLGTNCADNSPTPEAAENFIQNGVRIDTTNVCGYEFMQDFRVHVKTNDSYITKPYFTLPGVIAKESIAPSCLACFDYTNALADVVVGYMAAPLEPNARMDESFQTMTIRNARGAQMVETAVQACNLQLHEPATGTGSHEQLASATVQSDTIIQDLLMKKTVPTEGMPMWLGECMANVITWIGPKGVNFARYSIDYHVLRNYLYILYTWGEERCKISMPKYARDIVDRYLENDKAFATLQQDIINSKQ